MIINGDEIPDRDARGERIVGDSLMVLLHSGDVPITWTVPASWEGGWTLVLDSDDPHGRRASAPSRPRAEIPLAAPPPVPPHPPPGYRLPTPPPPPARRA